MNTPEAVTYHTPSVRSEVVEQEYRLQVGDLPEGQLEATISGVSYQGLEQLQPVLHFHGNAKALVLSRLLCIQIVELTGSMIPEDWIGRTVKLQSITHGDSSHISIYTGKRSGSIHWMRRFIRIGHFPNWLRISLFVLLLGLISGLYTTQNWDHISAVLSQLFP